MRDKSSWLLKTRGLNRIGEEKKDPQEATVSRILFSKKER